MSFGVTKMKELRRARAPETPVLRGKSSKSAKDRRFGIRYRFRMLGGRPGRLYEAWYEKRAGRNQAFAHMARPLGLPGGRTYTLYAVLEKIER